MGLLFLGRINKKGVKVSLMRAGVAEPGQPMRDRGYMRGTQDPVP